MAAISVVGGRDDLRAAFAPHVDHPVDRPRSEVRPVGEHDDRRGNLRAERTQAAPKGGTTAALPVRAMDRRGRGRDVVRAEDDDRLRDGASANALEHGLEQHALLGAAEACRGPGGEDDDG